jgi:hypothetical protein
MVATPLNTRSIACSTSSGLAAGGGGAFLPASALSVGIDKLSGLIGFSSNRCGGALAQLDKRPHANKINNKRPNTDGLLKRGNRVGKHSEARSFFISGISNAICF